MRRSVVFVASMSIAGAAACGDDGGNKKLPDAPPGQDAPDIDAAAQPVTLTVLDAGAPVPGVTVYFQNADSTLVGSSVTDAQGKASRVMDAGGFVTAVDPFPGQNNAFGGGSGADNLTTYAGVKPGDNLVLRGASRGNPVTFTVVAPVAPFGSYYSFQTNCGSGQLLPGSGGGSGGSGDPTPGGSVTLYNCGSKVDALVEAYDSDFILRNSFYVPDLAVSEGAAIDLQTNTYTEPSTKTFSYTNANADYIYTDYYLASSKGSLDYYYAGDSTTEGAVTEQIQAPQFAGLTGITDAYYYAGNDQQHVIDWGASSSDYSLDWTGKTLHDFTSSPQFDVGNHQITWEYDASGGVPDLTITDFHVYRDADGRSWTWSIVAPYVDGKATFPVVPTDVYDFNAKDTDSTSVYDLMTAKVPGGYDAVRAYAGNIFYTEDFALAAAGTTATGPVQAVTYGGGKVVAERKKQRAQRIAAKQAARAKRTVH